MIGQVDSYDPNTLAGVIRSEGLLFTFNLEDNWRANVQPDKDDDVSFDAEGTIANNIILVGAYLEPPKAVKYKYLAAVLALCFGWAGVHRVYLGFYGLAFMQLSLTVILYAIGLPGFAMLWAFIESILLFGGQLNKDAEGRPLK